MSPHIHMWCGTIRSCSLVEVRVPCWWKCVTVGAGFEVSYVQDRVHFLLPSVKDVVNTIYACMPLCSVWPLYGHDDNGLHLWSFKQSIPVKCFPYTGFHGVSSQQQKPLLRLCVCLCVFVFMFGSIVP